ncbi:hypothetical protein BDP27DRAFT_1422111 [Rhodocollybia butyracea]|uniref:Uncharacterized protein n=1 Tax=Rhodocollybia butyracea TaxID=206335 RepID=A0A9P5PQK8_9AGAR|nr:hypothetical protein BDP27DRAFT_1422111 [Rhodocollybia butyracea]
MALAYSFLSQILSMFPHDPLSHISGILDFSSQGIQQLLVNFKQLWEQHGLSVAGRNLAEAVVQDSTLRCCWAVKEEGFQAEVCFQMIESIKRLGEEFGMELSKSQTPPPALSSPSPLTAPIASSSTPTLASNASDTSKSSPHALTLVSPSKPTPPSLQLQPTSEFAREVAELRKAGRKLEVFMDEHVMGLEHKAGAPPARVHLSNTPTECTPVPYVAPVTAVPPTGLHKRVKHNMYGAFGSLLLRSSHCPSQSGTLMPSPLPTETPHHHICAPNQCSHSWRWRSTVSTVPPPSQSGLSGSYTRIETDFEDILHLEEENRRLHVSKNSLWDDLKRAEGSFEAIQNGHDELIRRNNHIVEASHRVQWGKEAAESHLCEARYEMKLLGNMLKSSAGSSNKSLGSSLREAIRGLLDKLDVVAYSPSSPRIPGTASPSVSYSLLANPSSSPAVPVIPVTSAAMVSVGVQKSPDVVVTALQPTEDMEDLEYMSDGEIFGRRDKDEIEEDELKDKDASNEATVAEDGTLTGIFNLDVSVVVDDGSAVETTGSVGNNAELEPSISSPSSFLPNPKNPLFLPSSEPSSTGSTILELP